jgi:hypothetical protein
MIGELEPGDIGDLTSVSDVEEAKLLQEDDEIEKSFSTKLSIDTVDALMKG